MTRKMRLSKILFFEGVRHDSKISRWVHLLTLFEWKTPTADRAVDSGRLKKFIFIAPFGLLREIPGPKHFCDLSRKLPPHGNSDDLMSFKERVFNFLFL